MEQLRLDLMHKDLVDLQKLEVEMVAQEQHQVLTEHQQAELVEVEVDQIIIQQVLELKVEVMVKFQVLLLLVKQELLTQVVVEAEVVDPLLLVEVDLMVDQVSWS